MRLFACTICDAHFLYRRISAYQGELTSASVGFRIHILLFWALLMDDNTSCRKIPTILFSFDFTSSRVPLYVAGISW